MENISGNFVSKINLAQFKNVQELLKTFHAITAH